MKLLLKCKIGQQYVLLPTEVIHYIQRATQWRQLPDAELPIVGAVQSRSGWIPVFDLASYLEQCRTTPRISTRMVMTTGSDGRPYALLCEQVIEVIKLEGDAMMHRSDLFDLDGTICRVWDPSKLSLSSFQKTGIGGGYE